MIKDVIQISLLVISLVSLASCSLLSPVDSEPTTKYVLDASPKNIAKYRSPRSVVLKVSTTTTQPIYNTTKMLYSIQAHQLQEYALNEWAKTPSEMLQPMIVDSLMYTRYFKAVITPPDAGSYDYLLNTQVYQLLQDYTYPRPQIRLSVHAQLIKASSGQVIATRVFNCNQPMYELSPYGGVLAANRATEDVLRQLVKFTMEKTHD